MAVLLALAALWAPTPVASGEGHRVGRAPVPELRRGTTGVFKLNPIDNYVFLQKYPRFVSEQLYYHTEVLVCPHMGFSVDDQQYLDKTIVKMKNFSEIAEAWWENKTADCIELGYSGDSPCKKPCCGVSKLPQKLKSRQTVVSGANLSKRQLYIYGWGKYEGLEAYNIVCGPPTCWSNWSGQAFDPLLNNCNTFSSVILYCIYNLSQAKPNLGESDLQQVTGHCPQNVLHADELLV